MEKCPECNRKSPAIPRTKKITTGEETINNQSESDAGII